MTQLYIGTYAKPGGRGVYPLTLGEDGLLALGECAAPARNSSFGAGAPARGIHYLVDECDSRLGVWRQREGRWERLADLASCGEEPCYLAVDEGGRRMAVANYKSGSLALFALDGAGIPCAPPASLQDSGKGPVKGRQDGPHMHCVRFGPDGRSLYAVDLGADHVLRLELQGARLGAAEIAWRAPPGSGPRHLLFHPQRPFALVISELACTLTLLALNDGRLEALDTCPTAPAAWKGENAGGHLEWPSATRAYVSNRGHDSVALIEVDLEKRKLTFGQDVPSGGKSPRHFRLFREGRQVVVAHEKDGTVSSFCVGPDGRLTPTGHRVQVPGSCYVFGPDSPNS
jgi:6-phosphogluconolactonase (cycloisomerase 2 family)